MYNKFLIKMHKNKHFTKKRGGGNCGSSGNSGNSGNSKKCLMPPTPPPLPPSEKQLAIIIEKIVDAKKKGLNIEDTLTSEEIKAYNKYLKEKQEKQEKFKAKEAERKANEEEESKRISIIRKRKEESRIRREREEELRKEKEEESRKKKEEEFRIRKEEESRKKKEEEWRIKEEEANVQIASYRKRNQSYVDGLIQNFGKSPSKISKRSKGGRKRTTRRNKQI